MGPSVNVMRAARIAILVVAPTFGAAALAQDAAPASPGVMNSLARQLKLAPAPVHSADFVEKSRPAEGSLHYIPTGSARPEPGGPAVLTADQIRAKEVELDALLARHNAIAHRAPVQYAVNTAAGRPFEKRRKKSIHCLVTCRIDPSKPPS